MLNVLLIDDDVDDRFLFGKALQKTGLEITYLQADCCNAALIIMDENINPDIIFLDINMPEENGYECLKKFESTAWSQIPVIIYTTSGHPDDVQRALDIKAAGYLKKPYDVRLLAAKLQEILAPLINA